ncbi:MAG: hypothetical protein E3J66_02245 [Dehalococcoidia bacterium]|nr:MAG: hypothetical protein E3J66_02245 [Dehalococcoidia bacterium]
MGSKSENVESIGLLNWHKPSSAPPASEEVGFGLAWAPPRYREHDYRVEIVIKDHGLSLVPIRS